MIFYGRNNFFVGLTFAVVGIGASMIYLFWNRWFKHVQRRSEPIADNNETNELKIIEAEYKKKVEIKPTEKEKAGKELQLKNEEKHGIFSLNSDDLEAPVPANQIKNTNLNGALAPRRDAMASKNNLEENNMGNFFGPKTPEDCQKEIEKHKQKMKEEMKKIEKFKKKKLEFENQVEPVKPAPAPQVLPPNISNISMRSNNDNSNWMDPNDINNSFGYKD